MTITVDYDYDYNFGVNDLDSYEAQFHRLYLSKLSDFKGKRINYGRAQRMYFMWGVCRDDIDKAFMLDYWCNGGTSIEVHEKNHLYQQSLIKRARKVANRFFRKKPNWMDM